MAKAKRVADQENGEAREDSIGSETVTANLGSKQSYEEWRCEIKNGKVEKLKKLRSNVKLSEEHVETLNGSYDKHSDYAIMYFLPEN